MPYTVISIALVLLAIVIGTFKLPKIETAADRPGEKVTDSIWKHRNLLLGAIGLFCVCGRRGFDRKFSGELFRLAGDCRLLREDRKQGSFRSTGAGSMIGRFSWRTPLSGGSRLDTCWHCAQSAQRAHHPLLL